MRIAISVSQSEKAKREQSPYFKALATLCPDGELELIAAEDTERVRAENYDGILFAGGEDLDPSYYGEKKRSADLRLNQARDAFEWALLDRALKRRLPVLGICRGLQLINVHSLGTLYQDLPSDKPTEIDHQQTESRGEATHAVTLTEPQSILAGCFRGICQVNSMHHQAVRHIGRGLKATARSEDGFVEALEKADGYPLLAVQWHPEEMTERPEQRKIFEQFVARCRERAAQRKAGKRP